MVIKVDRSVSTGRLFASILFVCAAMLLPLACPDGVHAAVETTTVTGKLVMPSGALATGGSVRAVLSQSGSSPDTISAASWTVGGRTVGTVAADGTVSITLVPNDAITPAGTYYEVRLTSTGPTRSTWREKWSVTTSPDPVDVGAITRLDVAPGITVGDFVTYVAAQPSGACTSADVPSYSTTTRNLCTCASLLWSCEVQASPLSIEPVDYGTGSMTGTSTASARNVAIVLERGTTGRKHPRMVMKTGEPAFQFWTGVDIVPVNSAFIALGSSQNPFNDLYLRQNALDGIAITAGTLGSTTISGSACIIPGFSHTDPDETQVTYMEFFGGDTSTTQTDVDFFMPAIAKGMPSMNVVVDVAPGTGASWFVAVVDSAAVVKKFCTISGTGTTCQFSFESISLTGGNSLVFRITPSAAPAPAAAASMKINFCLSPNAP